MKRQVIILLVVLVGLLIGASVAFAQEDPQIIVQAVVTPGGPLRVGDSATFRCIFIPTGRLFVGGQTVTLVGVSGSGVTLRDEVHGPHILEYSITIVHADAWVACGADAGTGFAYEIVTLEILP